MGRTTYKTAPKAGLYTRLSVDDGITDRESNSITSQKQMLMQYAQYHGIEVAETYVDDGWSGTNFERPDFKRMIEDIESGKINTVITKDLSRLGRDYLQTGYYTEVYFPGKKVRYIAISDGIDTSMGYNEMAPFKNLFNELYAKDTSKKVKSAKRARVMSGMYVATSAPYGYQKDKEDRHRLVIDERYAPTVRMIFDLAKEGKGISAIRSHINMLHILRPSAVNPNGYERHFDGEDDARRYEWSNNSIRGILRNPVYAGHLVMGKRVSPSFKSHKSRCVLPENYTVVKDVHEPIVDPADFELVQRLITSRRNTQTKKKPFENIFAGLVKCEDCGYAMTLSKAHRSPKEELIDEYGYMCNNYKTFGKSADTSHWIEARALYESVLADIQKHADEALRDNSSMVDKLLKKAGRAETDRRKALEKELKQCKARLSEVDKLFQSLYEDKISGGITERNYQMMSRKYEAEQTELEVKIRELEEQNRAKSDEEENAEQFAKLIKNYAGVEELSASLLNRLIEKITIGEAKETDGQRTQEVKIYYKFIGNIL